LPITGVVVAVGGLALAILPPFGTFVAYSVVERSAGGPGYQWLPPVLALATAVTGAAVLRAAGRIFLGLGPAEDDLLVSPPREEEGEKSVRAAPRRGFLLWGPAVALLVAGLGLGFVPGIAEHAVQHAERFVDRPAVAGETLRGAPPTPLGHVHEAIGAASYTYGAGSALLAVSLAWVGLYRRRIPRAFRRGMDAAGGPALRRLKLLHDGVVGEYVTWLTIGAAAITGLLALLTR
jgi:NADH:ubiquinone oxidoreductase subunit 5 (subunit L)/multisubunit Na+/H+ antiporter MnhA subunit